MRQSLLLSFVLVCFGSALLAGDEWSQQVDLLFSTTEASLYENYLKDGNVEILHRFRAVFWKRRDPTPETERNEFSEEYIQRLKQAAHQFAEGKKPGWRTDRGRIWLLLGPPDKSWQKDQSRSSGDPSVQLEGPYGRSSQPRTSGRSSGSQQSRLTWYYEAPPAEGFPRNLEIRFLQQPGTHIFKLTKRVDVSSPRLKGLSNNTLEVSEDALSIEGIEESVLV